MFNIYWETEGEGDKAPLTGRLLKEVVFRISPQGIGHVAEKPGSILPPPGISWTWKLSIGPFFEVRSERLRELLDIAQKGVERLLTYVWATPRSAPGPYWKTRDPGTNAWEYVFDTIRGRLALGWVRQDNGLGKRYHAYSFSDFLGIYDTDEEARLATTEAVNRVLGWIRGTTPKISTTFHINHDLALVNAHMRDLIQKAFVGESLTKAFKVPDLPNEPCKVEETPPDEKGKKSSITTLQVTAGMIDFLLADHFPAESGHKMYMLQDPSGRTLTLNVFWKV